MRSARCLVAGLCLSAPLLAQNAPTVSRRPLSDYISLSRPQLSLGTIDGPFSLIGGVARSPNGDIYVLDRAEQTIRVYDAAGRSKGSGGQSGRGPGDLAEPHGLVVDPGGTVFVADGINGVSVFAPQSGRPLVYRTRFAEQLRPTAVCLKGDSVIVHGFDQADRTTPLHVFLRDGRKVGSFGSGFNADTARYMYEWLNQVPVRLACDQASGMVFMSQTIGGEVRAYDHTGKAVWRIVLPEYNESVVHGSSRGGVSVRPGSFRTTTCALVAPGRLLIQATHVDIRRFVDAGGGLSTERTYRGVVNYLLDATTGVVITRAYAEPLIAGVQGRTAITYLNEPYPTVTVREIIVTR